MATEPPKPNIDVGRVVSRGFEALKANFPAFFLIALVLLGVPGFLGQYYMLSGVQNSVFAMTSNGAAPADPLFFLSAAYWGPVLASFLATILAYAVLQVMLTRATILQLSGRAPDIAGSFALALRLLLPVIGLTICVSVLVMIGLVLLIFPALMVWCALIVAVPALVEERRGVFASIARSRALTSGSRWQIFLLVVLIWILSMIVSGIAGVIGGSTMSITGPATMTNIYLSAGASAVASVITGLAGTVIVAALYVELREVKEGASTNVLADVFG